MNKIPLSVLILANQQSPKLMDAINSVNFADEIIVIDTSGTETISFSKQISAIVKQVKPVTNFAATRNHSLTFAHNNWVFFLDSDEVCICPKPDLLIPMLQKDLSGFQVNRVDYFLGKVLRHGETAKSWPTRLINKTVCAYENIVHEKAICEGTIQSTNPEILFIEHFPHDSIHSFVNKISWYSKLEAEQRSTSSFRLIFELFTYPTGKWIANLFFNQGLLDGYRGLLYATLMSYHSLFVRLFQLEKQIIKRLRD